MALKGPVEHFQIFYTKCVEIYMIPPNFISCLFPPRFVTYTFWTELVLMRAPGWSDDRCGEIICNEQRRKYFFLFIRTLSDEKWSFLHLFISYRSRPESRTFFEFHCSNHALEHIAIWKCRLLCVSSTLTLNCCDKSHLLRTILSPKDGNTHALSLLLPCYIHIDYSTLS